MIRVMSVQHKELDYMIFEIKKKNFFVNTGLLAFGVKESAMVTKIFTCINILVLLFIVVSGLVKGTLKNWQVNPDEILNATDSSGFK